MSYNNFQNPIRISSTEDGISTTTGALINFGGAYFKKNVTVGYGLHADTTSLLRYPPVLPLTSNITNISTSEYGKGSYITSASTTVSSEYDAFKGFTLTSDANPWSSAGSKYNLTTGAYTGSVTTTDVSRVAHLGEWLQIQFPERRIVKEITIYPRTDSILSAPTTFTLLGSNNGTTWTVVYNQTSAITWSNNIGRIFSFENTTPFAYYRLVSKSNGGGDISDISHYTQFSMSFQTVNTDSIITTGSLNVGKSLHIGSNNILSSGITSEVGGLTPLLNFGINYRDNPDTSLGGAQFRVDGRGFDTGGIPFHWMTRSGGSTTENTIATLDMDGNMSLSGNIHLTSTLLGPPTYTTRSVGTRAIIRSQLSGVLVDWAIGAETDNMWLSIPTSTSATGLKIYGGTTQQLHILGNGVVSLNCTNDSTSVTTGALQIAGGVAIRKTLTLGGGIQSFLGSDTTNTTLLSENYTTAPTGTLTGTAIWDSTNLWVRLQVAGQTHSNGTLAYTIPNLGRHWTLAFDAFYGFGNDEGFDIQCGGWIIGFSSFFNMTRIITPEGTQQPTLPPQSLPRNKWSAVRIQLVYDICYVYVDNVLITQLQSSPSPGTVTTNAQLILRGISGGFSSDKYVDNVILTSNSKGTQNITFSPFSARVGGPSSSISAIDDNAYGSHILFSTITGSTGSAVERMRITSNGDVNVTKALSVAGQAQISASGSLFPGTGIPASTALKLIPGSNGHSTALSLDATSLTNGVNWLLSSSGGTASEGQGIFTVKTPTTTALSINPSLAVKIHSTTENTGVGTGAFQVAGGMSVGKGLLVEGNFIKLNNGENNVLVVDQGNQERLGFVKQVNAVPKIVSASGNNIVLAVSNQTALSTNLATATITDLMTVGSAGVNILNNNLTVGSAFLFKTASSISDYSILGTNTIDGNTNTRIVLSGNTRSQNAGSIEYRTTGTGNHQFFTSNATSAMTINSDDTVNISTGIFNLNNASSNMIIYGTAGVSPPTFTTRSVGTKVVLLPDISGTRVDYALGVESSSMWQSVPTTTQSFKWYGGTTNILTVTGTGSMRLNATANDVVGHLVVDKPTAGGLGGTITIRNSGGNGTLNSSAALAFELDGSNAFQTNGGPESNAEIRCINDGLGPGANINPGALVFTTWNGTTQGERMRITSQGVVMINNSNYTTGQTNTLQFNHGTNGGSLIRSTLQNSNHVDLSLFGSQNNTSIRALTIDGATGNVQIVNSLVNQSTTDSSSLTTGSIQVAGGMAVRKSITVGGNQLFMGSDTINTQLLSENYTAAPTGTLTGHAVWDASNLWVRLQASGQTNGNGTLTYIIPNLGRHWTLAFDAFYGSGNDEGFDIQCGGWIIGFSSLFNMTRIITPEGAQQPTLPPQSLLRDGWSAVRIQLVYDICYVYVDNVLITQLQSNPSPGTVTTNAQLILRGISGVSSSNKYVDNVVLTSNSKGTETISFSPLPTRAGGPSSLISAIDDNSYGSHISMSTITGNTGTSIERLRITSAGDINIPSGRLNITNATSNMIIYGTAGVSPPTFTTRSVGTKVVLLPDISGTRVDYALGVESSSMWQSVPTTTQSFKWYGGTTNILTVTGTGSMRLNATANDVVGHLVVDKPTAGGLGGTITIRNSGGNGTLNSSAALAFDLDGSNAFQANGGPESNAEIRCINDGLGPGVSLNPGALVFTTWSGTAQGERMRITSQGVVMINNSNYTTGQTNTLQFNHGTNGGSLIRSTLQGSNHVDLSLFGSQNNTSIRALTIDGATGNVQIVNSLLTQNTTDSSSLTTGSVQVAGGMAVRKSITVGGSQLFMGSDTINTQLLSENYTTAPTGTLTGHAVWDSTNLWVRLQAAGQTNGNGTLTYTIPNLGRHWTLAFDAFYGSGNDEGFDIQCGGWIIGFSGFFNMTRIITPEGTQQPTLPPLSLPRDKWSAVRIQLVYDFCYVYVDNVLITQLQSSPSPGTVTTNAQLILRGISGGFSSNKYVDNVVLTSNSKGTETISFSPLITRAGGPSSLISAVDDNSYGSHISMSTITGNTGSAIERMRITSNGDVNVTKALSVAGQAQISASGSLFPGTGIPASTALKLIPGSNGHSTALSLDATSLTNGINWLLSSSGGTATEGQGIFTVKTPTTTALSINPSLAVRVHSTTENTGVGTGAFQVAGGMSVGKGLFVEGNFIKLTNSENSALIVDQGGQERLGFVKQVNAGPKIVSASGNNIVLAISNQTALSTNLATATITDLMTVGSGGVNILNNNLTVGSEFLFKTASSVSDYSILGTNTIDGNTNTRIVVSGNTRSQNAGSIEYRTTGTGNHQFFTSNATSAMTINSDNTVNISTGIINLNNATSNVMIYGTAGVSPPTFTTRSVGTKIVLLPDISGTRVDYAVGIESSSMWHSVPTTTQSFKWYGGTTNVLTVTGTGAMRLNASANDVVGHLVVDKPTAGGLGGTITIRNSGGNGTLNSSAALAFELDGSNAFQANGVPESNAEIRCINDGLGPGVSLNPGALVFTTWSGTTQGERMRITSQGVVMINNSNYTTGQTNTLQFNHGTNGGSLIRSTLQGSNHVDLSLFGSQNNTSIRALTIDGATGNVQIVNSLLTQNTTDSSSLTTGSVQVAGGMAVRKSVTVGGNQSFMGSDTINTQLLSENYTTAPTGTLTGHAVWDSTNLWVRLQAAGQTNGNGTLTYIIPNLGRQWTLAFDAFYGSGNDEGFDIQCGGWIIGFSSFYNMTRIITPEGAQQPTLPPQSLSRDAWSAVRIQLVYDICYVYVNNVLITQLQSNPSPGTVSTNAQLILRGISGGFSSNKYVDNVVLTSNSKGTETISFSPLITRAGGPSSLISAVDDNSYGSHISMSTITGNTGTSIERMRITSQGLITVGTAIHTLSSLPNRLSVQDTNGNCIGFYSNTTAVGSITTNGTSVSYNTTSDYRIKENIIPLVNATERIKNIPVHRFNFKGSEQIVDGFLAHEVQDIVPEAVTGKKDNVDEDGNIILQGIDQSKLVPLLVASMKEAWEEIENLKKQLANP